MIAYGNLKKQYGDIKQGLIAMCTPKLVYQGFFINEELLLEYEEKWLNRVKKYYDKRSERPQN